MRLWPFHRRADYAPPEVLAAYIRAGCPGSLAQWLALPPAAQAVMVQAAHEVRVEFILAVAAALNGGEAGVAAVADSVDGGEASDDVVLGRALAKSFRLLRTVRT